MTENVMFSSVVYFILSLSWVIYWGACWSDYNQRRPYRTLDHPFSKNFCAKMILLTPLWFCVIVWFLVAKGIKLLWAIVKDAFEEDN